ncbi:tRNA epoxyqueuosine(34) reductase QueG [Clostridium magnum]|uniref:Epoxyqueuosine reductase n=1 Tax=Clostridium magnum DSM 2767 TaxID=1121326 RepID=A0A162RMV2_9CLOT|nr:tRNA epoxyqueuosine(34) reductase QueG [Clostridium magnum]KZL90141.1 epoxyqueuosine reductase [Clostridium magnum DSM 2767]SHH62120.1 epoxyqueuosine reductase [Clostridium magnum DSM 2767]
MDYKNSILEYCKSLGLYTVGFTKCRIFSELKTYYEDRKLRNLENEFEEKEIEKRINPFLYMEDGKTIISIAFPYLFDSDSKEHIDFSKYTKGRDYHIIVSAYLKKVCEFIEGLGGKAIYFVDSNALPERYIAVQCGIGFVGKNNTVITKQYGSYVFLGEILTDLYVEQDNPQEDKCGSCNICQSSCPTGAIQGENIPNKCLSYITQKKDIEDEWFLKLKGRIFGCDTCQKVCPHNKEISLSKIEEFKPFDFMEKVNLEELANIDKKTFKEKYSQTSCGWRGKNVLQRNALINAITLNKDIKVSEISSPYVKDYYDRLLKSLNKKKT